jgi:hypothetical protein
MSPRRSGSESRSCSAYTTQVALSTPDSERPRDPLQALPRRLLADRERLVTEGLLLLVELLDGALEPRLASSTESNSVRGGGSFVKSVASLSRKSSPQQGQIP